MRIGVIGTGYVGLVTAACFSDLGHQVTAMDKDKAKINGLKKGLLPVYEPGLKELVMEGLKKKRLTFTVNVGEMVRSSDYIFIAVNTPSNEVGAVEVACRRHHTARSLGRPQGPVSIVRISTRQNENIRGKRVPHTSQAQGDDQPFAVRTALLASGEAVELDELDRKSVV